MVWEEFKELRELLMIVNTKLSRYIASDANSLNSYPISSVGLIALVPIFNVFTEQHFKDLTYRYVVSDIDLDIIKDELTKIS